jgi:tetratricopeptide (TPR) repeat protein
VLFRLGRIDEGEIQIRKALEKLDKDSVIYEHLGDILEVKGKRQEAKEYWGKALELDPKNEGLKEKLQK